MTQNVMQVLCNALALAGFVAALDFARLSNDESRADSGNEDLRRNE